MHTLMDEPAEDTPTPLRIGTFAITAGSVPYVIAEIGVNHDGKLDQAKRLIDAARAAGAQAVKFQVFHAQTLLSPAAPLADYQKITGRTNQQAMLEQLELKPDELHTLRQHCKAQQIEFLATPFSVEDLQQLLEMRVPAIKIASTDINHVPLLDAVIDCGRPALLSTGASEIVEIDAAVSQFDAQEACERLALLHCVSSYPTAEADAALSTIGRLRQRYGLWVGYSDHTPSSTVSEPAVACGAKILEKHLTLDRQMSGPDHAFSLTPAMFTEYVRCARLAHDLLGEPRETVFEIERAVYAVSRRSIVARIDIRKGQRLSAEHLAVKRPTGGIAPSCWHEVVGKKAVRDIAAETQITWEMVS